jgi:hypothetical protein
MVSKMGKFAAGDILPGECLGAVPFVVKGLNLYVPVATSKVSYRLLYAQAAAMVAIQGPVA